MLGLITIVSDDAALGPVKMTRLKVVGDGAYVAGGSVGFADAFNQATKEKREIIDLKATGNNAGALIDYSPQGPPVLLQANVGTGLLTTVAAQPLNATPVPVAHGYSAGDAVELERVRQGNNANLSDANLPTPFTSETVYYVIASGLTSTSFKLSATVGGAAIALTDIGAGRYVARRADKLLVRAANGTEASNGDLSGNTYTLFVISK